MTAHDIVDAVRISAVYHELTGAMPRRTGPGTYRAPGVHRGGDNPDAIVLRDSKNTWHDFVANEGGGVVDLVVRFLGVSRQEALQRVADYAGIPLDNQQLSRAQRRAWARARRDIERWLPLAHLWKRAALALVEEALVTLKAGLFDPTEPSPDIGELQRLTEEIARWQRMNDAQLVAEYRWWNQHYPHMTAGMLEVIRTRDQAAQRALLRFFELFNTPEGAA